MRFGYFDHAAAAPLLPEAKEAMMPFLGDEFGNPVSLHHFGDKPRAAVEGARAQVAALVNSRPDDIVFTASASESNNLAVKGLALSRKAKGRNIVVSAIEHVSVLEPLKSLGVYGFDITEVPVDADGTVHPDKLAAAIKTDTILVSVMHANYEVGTIQKVKELAAVAHRFRIPFHSDGTAAVGRIPVDVVGLDVDAYTFPAMSVYGPKGAAALYLKRGTRLQPLIEGGFQEKNRRAGTEDVAAIAGFGSAAAVTKSRLPEWSESMTRLAQRIFKELPEKLEHIIFTGSMSSRIPGHVSVVVEFVEGEAMLLSLDDEGIAAASGSSCSAKTLKASHVLLAMGLPHTKAQSSLVLTMGKDSTDEDVSHFLDKLPPITRRLRQMSPLYARLQKGEDPYAVKPGEACEDEQEHETDER
ncbi:cysteine desulfurase [candidate division WOR-3 bacterium]|uniref:Cysteine desulfurase n=1 Tax=candidate division WOR-3 bacterium TaxID=2052148 RepID=A0A938BS71_UNCW3|nr:cysteine desulfurase [candidate division WOR-3 bacterium]